MSDISNLLEKVNKIIKKNHVSEPTDFNIFNVLGIESREVYICRFLGELLNPQGRHGFGILFLKNFVINVLDKETDSYSDKLYNNASVVLEDVIEENRRVDIAIYIGNSVFPIEVKIWAGDQDKQLEDYYKHYFNDSKSETIFYLTPNGHEPSDYSRGELKLGTQIRCISFEKHIKTWIKNCLKQINNVNNAYLICKQFLSVIDKMTEESEMSNNILNSIFSENNTVNNVLSALEIAKNIDAIKDRFICDFINNNKSQIIGNNDNYDFKKVENDDKKSDSHIKIAVNRIGESKPIAYLCVDTNLYLKIADGYKKAGESQWNGDDWVYVYVKQRKINLKNPNHSTIQAAYDKNKTMDIDSIGTYLDSIEKDNDNQAEA
jgi:hypothetical protein